MIRKDQLPDIWGDDWRCTGARQKLTCSGPEGGDRAIVLVDEADYNLFRIGSCPECQAETGDTDNLEIDFLGGSLSIYRLQFNASERNTRLTLNMLRGGSLRIYTVTLGGRHIRNNVVVRMQAEHCELDAYGLYLMDHEQQVDNYIFVEHAVPRCTSRTLYKGIIDDAARARFNGHVLVQDGAVRTEAYQTNRNILLTDKAHVDTRPFLEIYNDDVKCSHGSTIGQLDEQAMFYLMTRGISQRTAQTMLSYAFCDEVVRSIALPTLRDTVGDMVKKRLHGELTSCADCAIACANPCNGPDAHFAIDPGRL
ncbi:MAG: SufD family Fe-S cluster assembly protein [Bacteroidales bacterium]|nr:SufD family Fe-S cluster assembly protein [Bacteroidales bacterium]